MSGCLSRFWNSPVVACVRAGIPLALMFSSAPTYVVVYFGLRMLTLLAPRRVFYEIDHFMWSSYQRVILFFAETATNTKIYFYGDMDNQVLTKESVIFICNHQCSFDWIIPDILAVRLNSLGNIRYILKHSLRYIPLYGWYFKQHGCVYVKRGAYDADSYRQQLLNLLKRGFYWLVIFPEGTRYSASNKKAIEANQAYADKFGLPTFEHVLTPKHRGFYHAAQCLGSGLDAIYDVTIAYEPANWVPDGAQAMTPSMASYITGAARAVHIHLKRIPAEQIPTADEASFCSWLVDRFRMKNSMLEKFYREGGRLDGANGKVPKDSNLSARHTLPCVIGWTGLTVLFLAFPTGRMLYKWSLLAGTALTMLYVALLPDRLQ